MNGYLDQKILAADFSQTIGRDGVGVLIRMLVAWGRAMRPDIKIGICGKYGGGCDPASA